MGTLVSSIVRHAITALAGYLLNRGLINAEIQGQLLSPEVIGSAAVFLTGVGWSFISWARAKAEKRFALIQPNGTAPHVFDEIASNTSTKQMQQAVENFVPRP